MPSHCDIVHRALGRGRNAIWGSLRQRTEDQVTNTLTGFYIAGRYRSWMSRIEY